MEKIYNVKIKSVITIKNPEQKYKNDLSCSKYFICVIHFMYSKYIR